MEINYDISLVPEVEHKPKPKILNQYLINLILNKHNNPKQAIVCHTEDEQKENHEHLTS